MNKNLTNFIFCILLTTFFSCAEGKSTPVAASSETTAEKAVNGSKPVAATPVAMVEKTQAVVTVPVVNKLGPMESIKDLDRQVEAYHLGQNLNAQQVQENLALKQKIIRGTFDISELCRLSLDKHWPTLKNEEQNHFVELMTSLLEQKAIFSKEQLRGENKYYKIDYLSEKIDPQDASKSVVTTKMIIAKRKMDLLLTYKLVKKDAGWKIYDVIVDEASLLSNYKFQFDRIIQKSGFQDLIHRMEAKLKSSGNG